MNETQVTRKVLRHKQFQPPQVFMAFHLCLFLRFSEGVRHPTKTITRKPCLCKMVEKADKLMPDVDGY